LTIVLFLESYQVRYLDIEYSLNHFSRQQSPTKQAEAYFLTIHQGGG